LIIVHWSHKQRGKSDLIKNQFFLFIHIFTKEGEFRAQSKPSLRGRGGLNCAYFRILEIKHRDNGWTGNSGTIEERVREKRSILKKYLHI